MPPWTPKRIGVSKPSRNAWRIGTLHAFDPQAAGVNDVRHELARLLHMPAWRPAPTRLEAGAPVPGRQRNRMPAWRPAHQYFRYAGAPKRGHRHHPGGRRRTGAMVQSGIMQQSRTSLAATASSRCVPAGPGRDGRGGAGTELPGRKTDPEGVPQLHPGGRLGGVCRGDAGPEAMPEMLQESRIQHRHQLPDRRRAGMRAMVDVSRLAAEEVGLNYVHLPFRDADRPSSSRQFLDTVAAPANSAGLHPLRIRQPGRRFDVAHQAGEAGRLLA